MERCKRFLGLFLCMALLATSLPATVLADTANTVEPAEIVQQEFEENLDTEPQAQDIQVDVTEGEEAEEVAALPETQPVAAPLASPPVGTYAMPLDAGYTQLPDSGTARVDLSAEGDIDWVKMEGAIGGSGHNNLGYHRKTIGGATVDAISVSMLADTGTSQMGDSRYLYSWGEGTFIGGADSTSATVYNLGVDNTATGPVNGEVGYVIDVAADNSRERTLVVYTSLWNSATNFSVYADGSNEASYSEDLARGDSAYRRYSIKVPQGVSLKVVGSVLEMTHNHGNIALGAVTLAGEGNQEEAVVTASYWQLGDGENSAVNLTRQGDIDWVKMEGVVGESGHNNLGYHRKTVGGATVDAIEVSVLPQAATTKMDDSRFYYSWAEGTFIGGVNSTSATVYNLGVDNTTTGPVSGEVGYAIDVAADSSLDRVLYVYTSVWNSTTDFSVYVDGDSTAVYSESSSAGYRRYAIEIPKGKSVRAVGSVLEMYHPHGNIALGAVALAEAADAAIPVNAPVSVTIETAGGQMDLTEMGTIDWVHPTGEANNVLTNRKKAALGGAVDIIDLEILPDTRLANLSDAAISFSWSDGTPDETAIDDTTGAVYMGTRSTGTEAGEVGYSLKIPADTSYRKLTFVSGVWQAIASIDIYVDDEPEAVYNNYDLTAGGSVVNKTYSITISPNVSIEVVCRLESKTNGDGNVNLQAVTLGEIVIPPEPSPGYYKAMLEELVQLAQEYDMPPAQGQYEFFVNQLKSKLAGAEELLEDGGTSDDYYMSYQFLLEALLGLHRMVCENQTYTFTSFHRVSGSFGWEGDIHAPIAFLDGSYQLRDRNNIMITFGVGDITSEIDWYNAEGYLPSYIHEYTKDGLRHRIENFADEVVIDGERYEIAYSRMETTNNTDSRVLLPMVSTALVALNEETAEALFIQPGETIVRDYAIVADRFGHDIPIPNDEDVVAAGGWDAHYDHMKTYWNDRLEPLAEITKLPAEYSDLINAYKAGFIYTLIVRDDIPQSDGTVNRALHVGENGYDEMFDHDTIGIVATLLTIGDFTYAKEYLATLPAQLQYDDAKWKYSWPYALYLMKTDDYAFIEESWPMIKTNTHNVETDRTAAGIIKNTDAIDSNGYWLIDNWAALAGLTTYNYLCEAMYAETGDAEYLAESAWAMGQYYSLLEAVEGVQRQLREDNNYPYLSISMTEITENSARSSARDGNWASMFLFGRWAWDGYLFGADQEGSEMIDLIDPTYTHGFNRRQGIPDQVSMYNFGGYPHGYFSSAYNAGYASSALRGEEYRDAGIKAYQFMIDEAMGSPYGWWEGIGLSAGDTGGNAYAPKGPASQWSTNHTAHGNGSNQHMWGQSTITKVLFDSLAAEKSDGTLIIGRGIPEEWILDGEEVEMKNYAVNGGRVSFNINSDGTEVVLTLSGNENTPVSWELLAFKNNIKSATGLTRAGAVGIDQANGIVTVPAGVSTVTVTLRNGELDKTALQALYDEYSALDENDYTAQSWAAMDVALTNASAVLGNTAATQPEIDDAWQALVTAYGNLVPEDNGPGAPSKAGLQSLYNKYKDTKQGNYTNTSWNAFSAALAAAKAVLDNPTATVEDITSATQALQSAFDALKENSPEATSRAALQTLYNAHKDKQKGSYTDASWKAFTEALAQAKAVLDNPSATPAEIATALAALQTAVDSLKTTGGGGSGGNGSAKTGDSAPLTTLVVVLGLAAIALASLTVYKKRRKQ